MNIMLLHSLFEWLERFENNVLEFRLRLISSREKDGRQYNLPSRYEAAALIVGDSNGECLKRDVIVHHKKKGYSNIFLFFSFNC